MIMTISKHIRANIIIEKRKKTIMSINFLDFLNFKIFFLLL